MKVKVTALNKNYLVEFKNDDQFVSFLTQHNDKINNIEILDEANLPATEKSVEMVKISKPTGWTTLEKSNFVTKETNVEKKGMTLGGKNGEFKYEPNKNLENSTTDKVSDTSTESPAMKGSEPKTSDVKEEPSKQNAETETETEEKEEKETEEKEEKEIKESVEDDEYNIDDDEYDRKDGLSKGMSYDEFAKKMEKRYGTPKNFDKLKKAEKIKYFDDEDDEELDDYFDEDDDEIDEIDEAAVTDNIEADKIEKAKQWVLKTTVQLQTLKKGEIAPIKKRDIIAKELANAAAIAFDTPVVNILKALQKDHKFFPNKSWDNNEVNESVETLDEMHGLDMSGTQRSNNISKFNEIREKVKNDPSLYNGRYSSPNIEIAYANFKEDIANGEFNSVKDEIDEVLQIAGVN